MTSRQKQRLEKARPAELHERGWIAAPTEQPSDHLAPASVDRTGHHFSSLSVVSTALELQRHPVQPGPTSELDAHRAADRVIRAEAPAEADRRRRRPNTRTLRPRAWRASRKAAECRRLDDVRRNAARPIDESVHGTTFRRRLRRCANSCRPRRSASRCRRSHSRVDATSSSEKTNTLRTMRAADGCWRTSLPTSPRTRRRTQFSDSPLPQRRRASGSSTEPRSVSAAERW